MNADCVPVVFAPHPFAEPVCAGFPVGQTLRDMFGNNDHIEVRVGGVAVAPEHWACVRPHAGTPVHVTQFPQGGGAGKWIRMIAMIAVMVAATYITMGGAAAAFGSAFAANTFGAAALGAAVMGVGMLAVTPLIPPPEVQR